jgi:hypothetical protein
MYVTRPAKPSLFTFSDARQDYVEQARLLHEQRALQAECVRFRHEQLQEVSLKSHEHNSGARAHLQILVGLISQEIMCYTHGKPTLAADSRLT